MALEERLTRALRASSWTVRESRPVSQLTERIRKEVGGFIDPATGRRDEARHRAFRERLAAARATELGCNAQLSAIVVIVRAPFAGTTARWDGAQDSVVSVGRVVLNAALGAVERGWVAALSLSLRAYDLEGNDLAFRAAGIEALVDLSVTDDQDVLPEDVWLTDTAKIDGAIRSALGANGDSLRHRGTPAGVSASSAEK
jgi:hypothetical protein